MKTSLFDMQIEQQLLRQQSDDVKKQQQKKHHDEHVNQQVSLEVSQQESKAYAKHQKHRSLLMKRRAVAEAMGKRATIAKGSKSTTVQKTKTTHKTEKAQDAKTSSSLKAAPKEHPAVEGMMKTFLTKVFTAKMEFKTPELEDLEFIRDPEELKEAQEKQAAKGIKTIKTPKVVEDHLKKLTPKEKQDYLKKLTPKVVEDHLKTLTPKEKQDYLEKLLNGSTTEMIDTLLDPKYLIGCKLEKEELDKLKQKAKVKARALRRITNGSLPVIFEQLRQAGFGSQLGNAGVGAPKPDSDNPNNAILAAMADSLELNALLQKLGIQSNISEANVQEVAAKQAALDTKAQVDKANSQIEANKHKSECQKAIQVLTVIAGVVMIALGQPAMGALTIASAVGLIDLVIKKLADALHTNPFWIKVIAMGIALLTAAVAMNPSLLGQDFAKFAGEGISGLSAFGSVMMTAATIGFTSDFLALCATGSLKDVEDGDYPAWVQWAALGINIAAMLPEMVSGINAWRVGRAAEKAAKAADNAAMEVEEAEQAANVAKGISNAPAEEGAAIARTTAAVNGEADAIEMVDMASRGEPTGAASEFEETTVSDESTPRANVAAMGTPGEATAFAQSTPRVNAAAMGTPGEARAAAAAVAEDGASTSRVSASEAARGSASAESGNTARAGSASEAASANDEARIEANEDGEDATAAIVPGEGRAGPSGYDARVSAADETKQAEEEKDPFIKKLRDAETVLQSAKEALERLERERGLLGLAEQEGAETASETSAQARQAEEEFSKAQKEVQEAEERVEKLRLRVSSQAQAMGRLTSELREAKQALASAEELGEEGTEAAQEARANISRIESEMKEVQETQQKLSQAEDKLAAAKRVAEEKKASLSKIERQASSEKSEESRLRKALRHVQTRIRQVAKVAELATQGATIYAQVQIAEIDQEIGQIVAEIAGLTSDIELLNTFLSIMSNNEDTTRSRNQQYARDLHDEVRRVGDIINAERQTANVLLSA